MIQTQKNNTWIDATGVPIPYTRVTGTERQKEKAADKLIKKANAINELMVEFKKLLATDCDDLYQRTLKENKADMEKVRKGNFTWYNFDKTVRIERNINERIDFKQPEIGLAKEKFDDFINKNVTATDEMVSQLVSDAFQNTKSGLDAKKVLSLLKYRSKIKSQAFQDALDLIEKSIERGDSKTYYKIALKNAENGEYEYIDLNFSNV